MREGRWFAFDAVDAGYSPGEILDMMNDEGLNYAGNDTDMEHEIRNIYNMLAFGDEPEQYDWIGYLPGDTPKGSE